MSLNHVSEGTQIKYIFLIQLNVLETPRPDLGWSNKGDKSVYYIDVPPGIGDGNNGFSYLLDKGDAPNVVLGTMKLIDDPGSKSKVLRIFWSLDMAQVPVATS